jgi:hypothetical protein
MDELKIIIAQPFKARNKARLTPSEFSFALSLELRWLTPDEARQALDAGLKAGLLREEKGKVSPAFDHRSVAVPDGFRPGPFFLKDKPLMEKILMLLASSGLDEAAAKAAAEKRLQELSGMVTPEVAGLIVARERGLDVSPYIDEAFAPLLKI